MSAAAQLLAGAVLLANGAAGAVAGWLWYRVGSDARAMRALRAGQLLAGLQAVGAGVLAATGFEPDGLYWLYALLPVGVFFMAEQLRIAAAEAVLESRGLPDAAAVGTLDQAGQRSVVTAILRRELGIFAVAALTVAFLALRVFPTV